MAQTPVLPEATPLGALSALKRRSAGPRRTAHKRRIPAGRNGDGKQRECQNRTRPGDTRTRENRMLSGQYGDGTMTGVTQQPVKPGSSYHEFSMWNRGDPAGNNARAAQPNGALYQNVGNILDGVMSGSIPDPTGGATHYYNPRVASPPWASPLAAMNDVTVGNHRFVGTGPAGPGSGIPVLAPQWAGPDPTTLGR
jgi:Cell Wall Hydrolase